MTTRYVRNWSHWLGYHLRVAVEYREAYMKGVLTGTRRAMRRDGEFQLNSYLAGWRSAKPIMEASR